MICICARRTVELNQVNVSKRRTVFDLVGWLCASENAGCCFYYLLTRMSRRPYVVVPDYVALGAFGDRGKRFPVTGQPLDALFILRFGPKGEKGASIGPERKRLTCQT